MYLGRSASNDSLISPALAENRSSSAGPPRNVVADARGTSAPPKRRGQGWENVKSFLGALVIFLVVRTFLVEAFRIPSGSMIPTLLIGDWLFVNKLRYGPHVPFTNINLPGYAEPARGEVVVFISPYQADEAARGADPTPTLVKRLWGVPGDTVHMRDAVLYINGDPLPQSEVFAGNPVHDPNEVNPLYVWQQTHALQDTRFGSAPSQPTHDNWGPLLVPAGQYFMLGDNRYESKDGRYWGLVPRENFRGRPLFVYYSWDAEASRSFGWLTDIRWDRIGHRIR